MAGTPGTLDRTAANLRIFVLGDVNLDTLIVPLAPHKQSTETRRMAWLSEGNYWRHRRRGGAWLLAEILNAALRSRSVLDRFGKVRAETYDQQDSHVDDATITSSLATDYLSSAALMGLFPQTAKAGPGDKKRVYRVERFLGWLHAKPDGQSENDRYERQLQQCLKLPLGGGKGACNVLVLHDRAAHFRHLDRRSLEEAIERHFEKGRTWIVWHMYSPLSEGNLWEVINRNKVWRRSTIIVVKMECLRQAGMNLPQATSLEQESRLFVEGIRKGKRQVPCLAKLNRVGHIVAHQHREGVLHYDCIEERLETSCYYCPYITEDPGSQELGHMVGYTSNLIAALVRGMAWSLLNKHANYPKEGIIAGIKQGAVLDHLHYLNGYGDENIVAWPDLSTPYEKLFATLTHAGEEHWNYEGRRYYLAALPLDSPDADLATWNRIDGFIQRHYDASLHKKHRTLLEEATRIASDVVRFGLPRVVEDDRDHQNQTSQPVLPDTPEVTVRCPFEVHGQIQTAYHEEIDSFATIRRILRKYINDKSWKTPLSIAVFGPPGSGKSFTIQQIFATVKPDTAKRPLEFNLAQFRNADLDLAVAFHKVQDEAVAGEVPLVFFDEFDVDELTFLKSFLAPMQDGTFKAGESTYRIGRAVFVFAGGVTPNWDEFCKKVNHKKNEALKGKDFVSRLRAHLDIATINGSVNGVLMFRRAVLLRSLLEHHLPVIFDRNTKEAQIDTTVIRAFLKVKKYIHEARSMRAIIEMAQLSPRGRFQNSSLPAADQLRMHVNESEFSQILAESDQPD